ncbi:sigma 54-interacting transcriptional regulator [uncultured Aquitalea sp.]|uniref:sigma-54 interaction domain-containing protein n=1 Tax=uncultured Aquitalea sp. TaxID=540272 RepID=UPI0025DE142E|nr:sigma 54-interacting transcriptional regulator [uncultured Aquitalea sp.]
MHTPPNLADYDHVRQLAMRSLFQHMDDTYQGTVIVDGQARIVWINARYAERFGYADPALALGQPVEKVIPNSLLRDVLNSGKPTLLDIMQTGSDQLVVTRLPLKDDSGRTVGAIGFALFDHIQSLAPLVAKFTRLAEELAATRESLAQARRAKYSFDDFVGHSAAISEVKRQAQRAAPLEGAVLLLGETGTGKEVLAHAIHMASARADKPLVSLNMAAIPDTLLEAELFGASAGAYTGMDKKGRVGKLQLADGGTLFLDEIGDLPLALQAKLLRVLQDKEFEALGSNKMQRADIRIIAATSARLEEKVANGSFRADLYYRLNVLTIHLPPLREHKQDLPALSAALLEQLQRHGYIQRTRLDDSALSRLAAYDWPGNVRELRNILERASMLGHGGVLSAADIDALLGPQALATDAPSANLDYQTQLQDFERQLFQRALREADGHVPTAAQRLGMGRATLYKRLAALGISAR